MAKATPAPTPARKNAKKSAARSAKGARAATQGKAKKKASGKKGARRAPKRARRFTLQNMLPEPAARIEPIQKAAERFDTGEGGKELNAAVDRLEDAVHDVLDRLGELESTTRERAEEGITDLLDRAQQLTAYQRMVDLPDRVSVRATTELDELLERLGLMRRSVHEAELAAFKKRSKAAQKAAAARKKKKAAAA